MIDFVQFKKIPRLSRECVITEKIDGTNAQIFITRFWEDKYILDVKMKDDILIDIYFTPEVLNFISDYCIAKKDDLYMFVGSRTRWITPESDNHGFARWVKDNSEDLFNLGIGQHFGEWWGNGIQRGYDLAKGDKRFSLFNVNRWCLYNDEPKLISINPKTKIEKYQEKLPKCCYLVPILYEGMFDTYMIDNFIEVLKNHGSYASKGFMKPEGIVIYHKGGNLMFKKTIENDDTPKSKI